MLSSHPPLRSWPVLVLLLCAGAGLPLQAEEPPTQGQSEAETAVYQRLTALIRAAQQQEEAGRVDEALASLEAAKKLAWEHRLQGEGTLIEERLKRIEAARAKQVPAQSVAKPAATTPPAPPQGQAAKAGAEPMQLSLEECIEIAIQNNLGLLLNRLEDRASDLTLKEAWAVYFPEFELGGDHSGGRGGDSHSNSNSLSGGITQRSPWGSTLSLGLSESEAHPGSRGARKFSGWDLSLSQPLWKDAGLDVGLYGIRSARIQRLISRGNLELAVQDLIFNVQKSYTECIRQVQTMEVNRRAVLSADKFLKLTEARERAQLVTKLEVFNAEVQKGNREEALLRTETNLESTLDNLKQLMDVDLEEKIRVDEMPLDFGEVSDEEAKASLSRTIETSEEAGLVQLVTRRDGKPEGQPVLLFQAQRHDQEAILAQALKNRVDLLNSRRAMALKHLQTLLRKDGLGQQIDLTASYSRSGQGSNWSQSHGLEDHDYSVGLRYSIPWGKITDRAAYDRALLALQGAEINLKQARTTVHEEVRDVLRQMKQAEKSIMIQGKTVEQSKRSAQAAKISFEQGLKDSFDVIRAEDNMLQAKTDFIFRRLEYRVRLHQLDLVIGKPTGRVDLEARQPGGVVESRLPEISKNRQLPRAAPQAEPHPANDPLKAQRAKLYDEEPRTEAPPAADGERKPAAEKPAQEDGLPQK